MAEWKPGNLVVLTPEHGESRLALSGTQEQEWITAWGRFLPRDTPRLTTRPLVVIDPEDVEAVAQLTAAWEAVETGAFGSVPMTVRQLRMQTALRSLVAPPKPEVMEHLAVEGWDSGTARALCGKVWRPDRDSVTVAGKCPECGEIAKAGWVA